MRWMLPLICVVTGALISGWPGAVIGFSVGCIVAAIVVAGRKRRDAEAAATTPPSAARATTVNPSTVSPPAPQTLVSPVQEMQARQSTTLADADSVGLQGIGVSLSFGPQNSPARSEPATAAEAGPPPLPTQTPIERMRARMREMAAEQPITAVSAQPPIPPSMRPQGVPPEPVRQAKPKLVWYAPGETLIHAGLVIDAGMIFVAERALPWPGETSAIITAMFVADVAADPSADFGYYASYDSISAQQRRGYLEWLAVGRKDDDPARRSLGYVFLFFYGLERRIILDGDRDPRLVEELIRLLDHYGASQPSRSLRSYFLQLLHFAGWHLGSDTYRELWPRLLAFDADRPDEEGLRFVLANLHQRGESLDWTVAYRLALSDVESRRSIVVSRAQDKFFALFEQRFREQFSEGLPLEAAKQEAVIQYRPASNALVQLRYQPQGQKHLELRLPNVAGFHSQFKSLPAIWNSCVDDLSGYSRALSSKKQGQAAALTAWQALPRQLRRTEDHPLKPAFDELVANSPREGDYAFVPTAALASLIGIAQRAKLSAAQSRELSEMVNELGWHLAPDASTTGIPLAWDQEVALYSRQPEAQSTSDPTGVVRLLYLALTVAAADGVVEDDEMDSFYRLVASQISSENDWHPVRATDASLRRDPNVALRSLPQMSKLIPTENRQFVLRLLAHIAAADSEVSLDELKVLRRIARAFQLAPDAAEKLFREDEAFQAVTIAAGTGGATRGEAIPAKPTGAPTTFTLNQERIAALTKETHEVISLLSVVMAESDDEAPCLPPATLAPPAAQTAEIPWLAGLEERYRAAVVTLVRHDAITSHDFDCIAAEHHLLPDDLFNAINVWADDTFGDFLLERGENVRIFRSLIPDLASLPVAA